ncbi:MAG: 3-phosphoshikimate 1-carboxyvinyltransferase [Bacteroidetes bacterium]|nr:3-phosphoshikimate 1-carboxyvinyltransferase [Bacteroidota bacterium]
MKTVTVNKADKILKGTILLPFSKSISNRLVMIRAMAPEDFRIHHLSEADDTFLLENLLMAIRTKKRNDLQIVLETGNAGTAMRFLTAYLSSVPGKWILTGSERMKFRPIGALVDALRSLGAEIEYLAKLGYPPLMIRGKSLRGGEIEVDATVSSQFVSALILIGPGIPGGLTLRLTGQVASKPYINMTVRLLQYFGVDVITESNRIIIPEATYHAREYTVEADWSSAAFWYEFASLSAEADLTLPGLHKNSLQGDTIIASVFQNFGVSTEFMEDGIRLTKVKKKIDGYYFNFSDYPDIALPVIATCAASGIRGRFEGLKSLKIKESDRLQAMTNEFEKLGIKMETETTPDGNIALEFPSSKIRWGPNLKMETYGDHRMAMTFAPLVFKLGKITIVNPDVVKKSYPRFWEHLIDVGFSVE